MKYFSMFSGIGGFEYGIKKAFESHGQQQERSKVGGSGDCVSPQENESNESEERWNDSCECVGFSEIDKYATAIYQYHFPEHKAFGDAFKIDPGTIPDFDLLVGGFPCQAFSIAGKRGGFEDTRGTLFFEIARILAVKRPQFLLLENVKGLLNHDHGRTFGTIISTLSDLGYFCEWQVLNSKDFGVPQNRERVFIVGHLGGIRGRQAFPIGENDQQDNESAEELRVQISNTLRTNYSNAQSNETYIGTKERIRRLTPVECERLQSFPDGWTNFGVFVPENKKGKCSKTEVVAIITDGKTRSVGFNYCESPVEKCPRIDGEGYEKCKTICQQPAHAEINALREFKGDKTKAICYINGHTRVCDDCTKALNVIPVVFGLPKEEISDSQRYKTLGNSVTTSVIKAIIDRMFL